MADIGGLFADGDELGTSGPAAVWLILAARYSSPGSYLYTVLHLLTPALTPGMTENCRQLH
jgi:hypothetical protein